MLRCISPVNKYWTVLSSIYNLEMKTSDIDRGKAESNIAFLSNVNCILDKLRSNICNLNHLN